MPLKRGLSNLPDNVRELNTGEVGKTRQKAIKTLAKKYNITEDEAKFKQSLIIAQEYAKKHPKA